MVDQDERAMRRPLPERRIVAAGLVRGSSTRGSRQKHESQPSAWRSRDRSMEAGANRSSACARRGGIGQGGAARNMAKGLTPGLR
jgi:hypothetical protein